MQQLGSNDRTVKVTLRDEVIEMPEDTGLRLMAYLTSDNTSSHVMITDIHGEQVVLNKNDIRKVSPHDQIGDGPIDITKLNLQGVI